MLVELPPESPWGRTLSHTEQYHSPTSIDYYSWEAGPVVIVITHAQATVYVCPTPFSSIAFSSLSYGNRLGYKTVDITVEQAHSAAGDGDNTLTPDDAIQILEEILPAQNQSYVLGMKLKVPSHVVEAIHSKEMEPETYLRKVILEFLKGVEPRPTWRVIVDALRSPAVRLHQLASKVGAAHFPDPVLTRDVVPETTSTATGTVDAHCLLD